MRYTLAILAALVLGLEAAAAATFNVTKTADTNDGSCDADCSLREAVAAANAAAGADTVALPAGNYVLGLGEIDLTDADTTTVAGAGAPTTVVDGNATSRVFHVEIGAAAAVDGVTIRNALGGATAATAGGAFGVQGDLQLSNAALEDNDGGLRGGGVHLIRLNLMTDPVPTLSAASVTLARNEADQGGGIYTTGDATLFNATLSDNRADVGNGGGLYVESPGSADVYGSTFFANVGDLGGGILIGNNATVRLLNDVFEDNGFQTCTNVLGTLTSLGHNLADDTTCALTSTGDIQNGTPALQPLANNGGPVPTHAIGAGSDALEAGDDGNCLFTDARGVVRPQDGDNDGTANCDIGAFELEASTPPSCSPLAAAGLSASKVAAAALYGLAASLVGLAGRRRR